jgi:putative N-acylglucosamine-6-phosphate 2-epimerase
MLDVLDIKKLLGRYSKVKKYFLNCSLKFYFKIERWITFVKKYFKKTFKMELCFYIMLSTDENAGSVIFRSDIMSKLSHQDVLSQIQYGLIASCQPVDDGPMDKPEIVSAMAQASVAGGASGLRIEGVDNLKATRAFVNIPIIGIVKRDLPDSPIRITPFLQDIEDLANSGADIIAVDGTSRPRPVDIESAVKKIHEMGCLAMADCSNLEEGLYCQKLGFDIVGSTMSGYTGGAVPEEPDYQLVKDLKAAGCFVMAEGRYNTPELAKVAIEIGADCVTVGSALTRLEHIVSWFANSVKSAR